MTAAPKLRPTQRRAPYDLAVALGDGDWRARVEWPIGLEPAFAAGDARLKGLAALIRDAGDADLRDILALAGVRALVLTLAQIEAALTLSAARRTGLELASDEPEVAYLSGGGERPPARGLPQHWMRVPPKRRLRELRGALRWTPAWRAPLTWLLPTATVLNENAMLRDAARQSGERLDLRYAEALYRDLRARDIGPGDRTRAAAAGDLLTELLSVEGADADIAARQRSLAAQTAHELCREAARDLAAARRIKLPQRIWGASGGRWPGRVLTLEILRRGGQATRFDHGGGRGLNIFPAWPAVLDLPVSTRYVMATERLASRLRAQGAAELAPRDRPVAIAGHRGDPTFARLPRSHSRQRPARPRVLYASGVLRGFRQTVPAQLPDVLYLDWQFRLVAALHKLPIELVCRPHPMGVLAGRPHPISALVQPAPHVFEELLPDVDVVLLDQPHSTTFYSAICTDRPVVLLDFGTPYFDSTADLLVAARCTVLRTAYDERHRPTVDEGQLAEALLGGSERADPTAFRELLIGELA
jgi:hypothetical protein